MLKIKMIYLILAAPTALLAMNESMLIDARAHLGKKKEALTRVYEEMTGPYHANNAQIYLQNKLNNAVDRAENGHQQDLIGGTLGSIAGVGLLIPVIWPKVDPSIKVFCGGGSFFSFLLAGWSFYDFWHFKKPTLEDIIKKVQSKLTKPYDGKRMLVKKMGLPRWYAQPQAAHNPHNK